MATILPTYNYKISIARCGKKSNNYMAKGMFVKRFSTLDELALYIANCNRKLFFPLIKKELTKKERLILDNKVYHLKLKQYKF